MGGLCPPAPAAPPSRGVGKYAGGIGLAPRGVDHHFRPRRAQADPRDMTAPPPSPPQQTDLDLRPGAAASAAPAPGLDAGVAPAASPSAADPRAAASAPGFFQSPDGGPRVWWDRALVLAFATAAGLAVVFFTWLAELAGHGFDVLRRLAWWSPLLWTPAVTVAVLWWTRRFAPGAGGSGIPQVIAALEPTVPVERYPLFVSAQLAAHKIGLVTAGLLGGLSVGREGPSVQVAAGVMLHARDWISTRSAIPVHALLAAGGAAGIAAAFNTPLGGVVFAIEELSRRLEQRNSGLLIAGIVLAGVVAIAFFGNNTYFGLIRTGGPGWGLFLPGALLCVVCGFAGGLFSRLLVVSLLGLRASAAGEAGFKRRLRAVFLRLLDWRSRWPLRFAAGCGLAVALLGLASNGASFGGGYGMTKALLDGEPTMIAWPTAAKFLATWLSAWSGVPGGIFAPALSIGAGLGQDVAALTGSPLAPALIALGMAAFLAAVTQAPLTAFIIVMEMVDGHAMVLSLMAAAGVGSTLSRLIAAPLYPALAQGQLARLSALPQAGASPQPAAPGPAAPAQTSPARE